MRRRCVEVLALGLLFGLACGTDLGEAPGTGSASLSAEVSDSVDAGLEVQSAQASESAQPSDGVTTSCGFGSDQPAGFRLVAPSSQVDAAVGPSDALELQIEKVRPFAATFDLEVRVQSVDLPSDVRIHITETMQANEATLSVNIPLADLNLATSDLPVSRRLFVQALAHYADDVEEYSRERIERSFHPTTGGWQLYSQDVREQKYWNGALTADERQRRQSTLAHAPPGFAASGRFAEARAIKRSDDPFAVVVEDDQ